MVFGHHKGTPTVEPSEHLVGTIIVTTDIWRNITLVCAAGLYSLLPLSEMLRR